MVAFGSTPPDESLATPRIVPVGNCAATGIAIIAARKKMPKHIHLQYCRNIFGPLKNAFKDLEIKWIH